MGRLRRHFTDDGCAVHLPAKTVIVIKSPVDRGTVIRNGEGTRLPTQAAAEGGLSHVLFQEAEKPFRLRVGHTLDAM